MLFAAIAGGIIGGVGALAGRSTTKAFQKLEDVKANAANMQREGMNALNASNASLSNFQRTQASIDRGKLADSQIAGVVAQTIASMDKLNAQDFSIKMQGAAEIGTMQAVLGATGVMGSSTELIQQNVKLAEAMSRDLIDVDRARLAEQEGRSISDVRSQQAASTDLNATFAAINRMTTFATVLPKPNVLMGVMNGAANGATKGWAGVGETAMQAYEQNEAISNSGGKRLGSTQMADMSSLFTKQGSEQFMANTKSSWFSKAWS